MIFGQSDRMRRVCLSFAAARQNGDGKLEGRRERSASTLSSAVQHLPTANTRGTRHSSVDSILQLRQAICQFSSSRGDAPAPKARCLAAAKAGAGPCHGSGSRLLAAWPKSQENFLSPFKRERIEGVHSVLRNPGLAAWFRARLHAGIIVVERLGAQGHGIGKARKANGVDHRGAGGRFRDEVCGAGIK